MPSPKDITSSRHPSFADNSKLYRFYADIAGSGPDWALKVNPLAVSSNLRTGGLYGQSTYLGQHPLESNDSFLRRANKAPVVDVTGPGLALYCGTVGSPDSVTIDVDPSWAPIIDNYDCLGNDFCSFWNAARQSAAVAGLSFLLVDSPKVDGLVTEADAVANGVRPYARLIKAADMLNWRLDQNGQPLEVLFRLQAEPAGSIIDASGKTATQYRYWSRTRWIVFEDDGEEVRVIDQGDNTIGRVPVVVLCHERGDLPWQGNSLIKTAAKYQLLLSNWLSDFSATIENQSFSQPVLKAACTPAEIGFGSSVVMTLKPDTADSKESFEFVSPGSQALESGWKSYIDTLRMVLRSFGISADPFLNVGRAESGESKMWTWKEVGKKMVSMTVNEQAAVDAVMDLMALYKGEKEFTGNIMLATSFDKAILSETIDSVVKLMALQLPATARKELMKSIIAQALPDLDPDASAQINKELDAIPAQAAAAAPFMAPAGV
jgi:hypothetical protein